MYERTFTVRVTSRRVLDRITPTEVREAVAYHLEEHCDFEWKAGSGENVEVREVPTE